MIINRVFLAAGVLLAAGAAAQQAPTLEEFFRSPAYLSPVLSNNGKHFAVSVPINGRMNLAVIDLETRKGTALTNFKDFDILGATWVGNDYLLFSLGKLNSPTGPGRFDGGGLFMVSRDGKESRRLSSTVKDLRRQNQYVYRGYEVFQRLPDSNDEVIVSGNMRDADSDDLYRMNIKSGKATLLTPNRPARSVDWVLDRNYVPRIVRSWVKDTQTFIIHYRKDEKSPWEEMARYDRTKGPTLIPLAFESDNQTLQVAYNSGRDTMAIFRYDPNARKLGELIAQHPRYDMGADAAGGRVAGVRTDFKTNSIIGYTVNADKPQTVWIDENYARIQRTIDQALPETYNTFFRTPDGDRLVITARSDRHTTRWYLLDEKNKTLEELFASRPWLKPEQLVEMRPFLLRTRDGLEIPSYYFLPKNRKPGERLPTVVHIHGGPHLRADSWGFGSFGTLEGQLFASRGYAVILPNFRITPGFGGKIYYSGFGTYGRQMVEDHEDATRWAIAEGIADPKRICISGASYGGAAVLLSLAKTPDLYKCGIAGAVVSDMRLQLTSTAGDTAPSPAGVAYWLKILGAESTSTIDPVNSPVNFAATIKSPIMMYAGVEDIRTPLEQTTAMRRALERAGNPPNPIIIKEEEGHGFGKPENNVELYTKVLEFLDTHIGSRSK